MRIYLMIAGLAFLFTAGMHAARVVFGWSAVVNGIQISTNVDFGTIAVALCLAFGAFWFAIRGK